MRWAILGTGAVSDAFVRGLRTVPGARAAVVASRDRARAQLFAARHRIPHALGGYDAAAIAAQADIAYVATPTALHAAHALACLAAGLPVLVEKPFAASAAEAEQVLAEAQRRALFAMEALWTRFLPAAFGLRDTTNETGDPLLLHGGFGIANAPAAERPIFRADLAGGAMRHYGIYPLALGQMLAGRAEAISAAGRRAATGVDATVAVTVRYASGAVGQYFASLEATAGQTFEMLGPRGQAGLVGPLYRPTGVRLVRTEPRRVPPRADSLRARLRTSRAGERLVQWLQRRPGPPGRVRMLPYAGNGYGAEAEEAQRCVAEGLVESAAMPHSDTLELARLIDSALAQLGQA